MENKIRILVIEDEALIAEHIRLCLEDFDYNVTAVCYGYEKALAAITAGGYDIIITDINLGEGIDLRSGLTLMQHLKTVKNCPFIFLTAFSDKDTIKKAAALKPFAYLVKPVNATNLFASLQLAVENFNTNHPASLQAPGEDDAPDYFFTKLGNEFHKLYWRDVYVIESLKNYVRLYTGTDKPFSGFLIRSSLQQVLNKAIPEKLRGMFTQISRSIAVQETVIDSVSGNTVRTRFGDFEATQSFKPGQPR